MDQITTSKKWGIGSFSLFLSILGVMFSFTFWNGKELGKHFLNAIGISFPAPIISLILLFISLFIGHKYKNYYLAKSGKAISIVFISTIFFFNNNKFIIINY